MQNRKKTWPKTRETDLLSGWRKMPGKKGPMAISAVTVVVPLLKPVYTAYFVVLTLSCMTNQAV